VLQLLRDKEHVLASPDVIISGVGTAVHTKEVGHSADAKAASSTSLWVEDLSWRACLEKDWDVKMVKLAVQTAINQVSNLLPLGCRGDLTHLR
jgi:hypothetical protein